MAGGPLVSPVPVALSLRPICSALLSLFWGRGVLPVQGEGKRWDYIVVCGITSSGDPELSTCALGLLSLFSEPLGSTAQSSLSRTSLTPAGCERPPPPSRGAQKRLVDWIWDREGHDRHFG